LLVGDGGAQLSSPCLDNEVNCTVVSDPQVPGGVCGYGGHGRSDVLWLVARLEEAGSGGAAVAGNVGASCLAKPKCLANFQSLARHIVRLWSGTNKRPTQRNTRQSIAWTKTSLSPEKETVRAMAHRYSASIPLR
jgi:hypothetical protein